MVISNIIIISRCETCLVAKQSSMKVCCSFMKTDECENMLTNMFFN